MAGPRSFFPRPCLGGLRPGLPKGASPHPVPRSLELVFIMLSTHGWLSEDFPVSPALQYFSYCSHFSVILLPFIFIYLFIVFFGSLDFLK